MDTAEKVKALEQLRDMWRNKYNEAYRYANVEIGDFTYGFPIIRTWGEDTKLKIGKFCSIGGNVKIYLGGNHHNDWGTTYPFNALFPDIWGDIDNGVAATKGDVTIGNDVWIADDVTILSGVTIGDGATIANGAVVTRNVYANTLVAGNPAKTKTIFYHKVTATNLQWWNWPLDELVEAVPFLMDHDLKWMYEYHIGVEKARLTRDNEQSILQRNRAGTQFGTLYPEGSAINHRTELQ